MSMHQRPSLAPASRCGFAARALLLPVVVAFVAQALFLPVVVASLPGPCRQPGETRDNDAGTRNRLPAGPKARETTGDNDAGTRNQPRTGPKATETTRDNDAGRRNRPCTELKARETTGDNDVGTSNRARTKPIPYNDRQGSFKLRLFGKNHSQSYQQS